MESTLVTIDEQSIEAIITALGPFLDEYLALILDPIFLYIQLAGGLVLGGLVGVVFWLKLRT